MVGDQGALRVAARRWREGVHPGGGGERRLRSLAIAAVAALAALATSEVRTPARFGALAGAWLRHRRPPAGVGVAGKVGAAGRGRRPRSVLSPRRNLAEAVHRRVARFDSSGRRKPRRSSSCSFHRRQPRISFAVVADDDGHRLAGGSVGRLEAAETEHSSSGCGPITSKASGAAFRVGALRVGRASRAGAVAGPQAPMAQGRWGPPARGSAGAVAAVSAGAAGAAAVAGDPAVRAGGPPVQAASSTVVKTIAEGYLLVRICRILTALEPQLYRFTQGPRAGRPGGAGPGLHHRRPPAAGFRETCPGARPSGGSSSPAPPGGLSPARYRSSSSSASTTRISVMRGPHPPRGGAGRRPLCRTPQTPTAGQTC